jgi:hypothetical protein
LPHNLYAAWQDERRSWHTIGRLSRIRDQYDFVFTKGAKVLGRMPKDLLGMNVDQTYRSSDLFALFKNKLPSRSRPDFRQMSQWLNLTGDETDFDLLSKFGLIPGTDSTLVYPEPELVDGRYAVEFFVHGIRHMEEAALKWTEACAPGDRLLPMLDVQNPMDASAVTLRPESKCILIGYVPAFYATDFYRILSDPKCVEEARVTVLKSNPSAPPQLRLLCRFETPAPKSFIPLNTDEHEPWVQPVRRIL